jgi:AcrR family transcriptional regulator
MSELGLRDRKRIATRHRIADAARTLALETDIDATTIDAIAARADISPRTFFNYFESKEDAVLGLEELDLDPATLAEHVHAVTGMHAADATVQLVFLVFGDQFGDAERRRQRKEVVVRFPQLVRRQVAHMTTVAEALKGAVRTLLERDPAWGGDAATTTEAEMLLGMCMTAIRAVSRDRQPTSDATLQRRVADLVRSTAQRITAS